MQEKLFMIKVTDYIANFLVEEGIEHVFMLTGGGAMHLNDSLGKHPRLSVTFNHHEQACAMAAESYARLTNKIALVNVTTGPGCFNTLNGVFGGWTDSIPMLIISGQVRYDTTLKSVGLPLRQMGDQECDIVASVKPITKYAAMVTDANDIRYHLQKALYMATQGRPGPVWLDIPMNIQGLQIDPANLRDYDFPPAEQQSPPVLSEAVISDVIAKIKAAERPVIFVGTGVRLAGLQAALLELIETLKIPIVTAFNAHDLVTDDNAYYVGRPGTIGDRAGNYAVQNADLLLVLGCRLNIRQIGYYWQSFARAALKIAVDIDATELTKPTVRIDLPIHADLRDFIPRAQYCAAQQVMPDKSHWLQWCKQRKQKYPVVLPEYWQRSDLINPYCFMQSLSEQLAESAIIVTANATACITAFQTLAMKRGQRLYSNSGSASMGYDLPAAIGACVGAGGRSIVCLAGDGSIQLNIQELATIRHYQLPIKIFWLNNDGYHSIRQTQNNFFGKPYVGTDTGSGLFFPAAEKIAAAYEITYYRCKNHTDMGVAIAQTLAHAGPVICEVMLTTEQVFAPKSSSKRLADGRMVSRPLEDLAPFLGREELKDNMLIELLAEE
jgi:acetolactate synthase I/II/III large subunit